MHGQQNIKIINFVCVYVLSTINTKGAWVLTFLHWQLRMLLAVWNVTTTVKV